MTIQTFATQITRSTRYKLNNGQSIPVAGFGVYLLPPADTAALVYQALEAGYRHIDGAFMYGNQRECAQGIAHFLKEHPETPREEIWFTTKISNEDQGYEAAKKAVAQIASDVEEYIGYVDLILIHSPMTDKERRTGTWKALTEFYQNPNNGVLQVRSIGVSNYAIKHIEEILAMGGAVVTPVINQLELHPWLPRVTLREYLTKKGILVEAFSPLTRGRQFENPELLALEKKYGIPKTDILLKWAYLQGFVVLVKSSNKNRMRKNIEILPESSASGTALEDGNLGKVDLDPEILDALDKPQSHEVFTWGGKDPTEYEG